MALTYEMICAARKGDPYALQQILNHYGGYISHAASEIVEINGAGECRRVNTEIRELIEADLMAAILRWKEKDECKSK